ncbi:MAG: nucleotidyltransferase [Acidilobaceae archaeon]
MVSRSGLSKTLKILLDSGFRFTIIGGTIVEYSLGKDDLGDDVDLFAEYPSVIFEENEYRRLAEDNSWVYGYTWLGTPRIVARVYDEEIPLEFYENIYDFYVPEAIIEGCIRVQVGDIKVRIVTLEDHILLKANAGRSSDIDKLKEIAKYIKRGRLSIDKKRLLENSKSFEDSDVIVRRLKDVSIL